MYDERLHKDGGPVGDGLTPAPYETTEPSVAHSPFEMSPDSTVKCEEFDRKAGAGKRCLHDGGTCPVNGDPTRCGERD